MLEEELKNRIATKYFKKFDCDGIIKRIDFSVRMRRDVAHNVSTPHTDYLLWAEAKQQPTDIYRMLAQAVRHNIPTASKKITFFILPWSVS